MKDLKTQMQEDLTSVTGKLEKARAKAEDANSRVQILERQQVALQSALDIMEGKGPVVQQYKPFLDASEMARTIYRGPDPTTISQPGEKYTDFNGELIILEPGMRIGKNSFGEDVLLPENMPDPEPLPEPTVPIAPPSILPPIGQDAGFAADLPGGL